MTVDIINKQTKHYEKEKKVTQLGLRAIKREQAQLIHKELRPDRSETTLNIFINKNIGTSR